MRKQIMATRKPPKGDSDLPRPPPTEDVVEPQAPVEDTPSPAPTPEPTPAPAPIDAVDKEKLLTFLEDIIDTLTFKRVGLIALLTVVALILFSVYENRTKIVTNITKPEQEIINNQTPTTWTLSDSSKAGLIALARGTKVGMLIISDVDLKKNRRSSRFNYIDDQTIVLEAGARQALSLPLPVFDYDARNTQQMVSVLSNEFRCDPYRETIYYRYAPELEVNYPIVCRIAIPPFVGNFVGFLTVGVVPGASQSELDQIRLEVSRLAVDIYMNDVNKATNP